MSQPKTKSPAESASSVPKAVVTRLSLYLRELQRLLIEGKPTTSSHQLGDLLGFTGAQVRKDLAFFGQFGHPGLGYRSEELVAAIRKILGTDQLWPVALVGLGNLGTALLGYKGFSRQGFNIRLVFDVDRSKVGTMVEGLRVDHLDDLSQMIKLEPIRLGMIAVPSIAAQSVADQLVDAGVRGIVNFAPVTLSLPNDISLKGVDLAIELEQVSFSVVNRPDSR